MSILVVENYIDGQLGLVAEEFDRAGVAYTIIRAFAGEPLPPSPGSHNGLVILGGTQSALDDDEFPYLAPLATLARQFGDADKAVLGICLGAQIIARGFGATNVLDRPIELGYLPLQPTAAGAADPVTAMLGESAALFHWHTDTFSLPDGAIHLATSAMTPHQAFRIGRAAYAMQFHFEVTPQLIERWLDMARGSLDADMPGWRETMDAQREHHARDADRIGREMTRAWLGLL